MQHFKIYLAGGDNVPVTLPQEEPIAAYDFYQYLVRERTGADGITVIDAGLCVHSKAIIGVEKVESIQYDIPNI